MRSASCHARGSPNCIPGAAAPRDRRARQDSPQSREGKAPDLQLRCGAPQDLAHTKAQSEGHHGAFSSDDRHYAAPASTRTFPVIRLTVDLGALEEWPSAQARPASTTGCSRRCPASHEHGCSYGEPGGFVRRLTEDERHLARPRARARRDRAPELAGATGHLRQDPRRPDVPGLYHVVYEYEEETSVSRRGELALKLLHSTCCPPSSGPPDAGTRRFRLRPASSTSFIRLRAAPRSSGRRARRRWCAPPRRATSPGCGSTTTAWSSSATASTSSASRPRSPAETPHIAVEIASDKEETNRLLGELGLPVPRQRLVRTRRGRGRRPPSGSATRWWSSRSTPTTAAASRSI